MAIKATKPTATVPRLKLLLYGVSGSGKTTAAIQFPRPVVYDTERGAIRPQYVKKIEDGAGAYLFTTDADELIGELCGLLENGNTYRTVVIDPLTIIYNDLIDKGIAERGEDYGRYKIPADRKIKHLIALLTRLDMNVVITSHSKDKWVRTKDARGKEVAAQEGTTFDCYPKLDYMFDLAIEVQRRGKERIGIVRKSRVESMPEGLEISPFGYDAIADLYGRDVLEREAAPQPLATAEQVRELRHMIGVMKLPEETVTKWLDKADAATLEEMSADIAAKCIDWCRKQIKTGGEL